ncbi:MAG TPA: hypothetical protein VKA44_00825 [Gemmatimonadota bacterium]|nr:hypothetical protein [Gemmatimonadota bacterium]
MLASDRPEAQAVPGDRDDRPDVEEELASLARVVERLVEEHVALRERAARAEKLERGLSDALEGSELDELSSEQVAGRLRELAEENERLREVIRESRERAERIRGRLILMEDEA